MAHVIRKGTTRHVGTGNGISDQCADAKRLIRASGSPQQSVVVIYSNWVIVTDLR